MAQHCRVEVSDRGERTKEERRGDSLVGGGEVGREESRRGARSYSTTSCPGQETTVWSREGGRGGAGGGAE